MIDVPTFLRYVDAEPSWAKQLEGEMTRGRHVITFRARHSIYIKTVSFYHLSKQFIRSTEFDENLSQ